MAATTAALLQDSMYQSGNPSTGYLNGLSTLFPSISSTQSQPLPNALTIGDRMLVYLRFLKTDSGIRSYTSIFYPAVDDYSQLSIPNSWPLLDTFASSNTVSNTSLILYYAGRHFDLPYKGYSINNAGVTYYVPARTAIISLKNGILTDWRWEDTTCTLNSCNCVDQICVETCPSNNCNITVRIGFTGTDSQNNQLTSLSRSIYRFKSAV